MSVKSRILGRDVQIRIARGGAPLTTITAIKSITFETRIRILTEQYLGEVASRQDSIFDEVGGSFSIHPESPEAFVFQRFLVDKAIRRQFDEDQVTITFRYTFPNRQIAKFVVPNVEFEQVPINAGSRDGYVDMAFTYKGESYTVIVP